MELKEIKCESCGHVNPPGTQLCQSCGKMINSDYDKNKIKDLMRYDGSAVRSKTKSKSIFDKIWIFFTSIKVGVSIILAIAIAASIGTIFPQEYFIPLGVDPAEYYQENYGTLGYLYYSLGFHNLYSSWWFLILNGMLALSIIAASIDRGVPLFKSLSKQRVKKHDSFFRRQRLFLNTDRPDDTGRLIDAFSKKRYKVRQEGDNYLLEKGRLSRYGPYINHTGLIILLFGSMLRFFPGMYVDEIVHIPEGETEELPTTEGQYYVKNEAFSLDTYDEDAGEVFNEALSSNTMLISNYQTDITFYENNSADIVGSSPDLEAVDEYSIRVNHPYRFGSYELYQSSYDNSQLKSMTFRLEDADGNTIGDNFTVNLGDPESSYDIAEGVSVNMRAYSPDFLEIDDNGTLVSATPVPRNPAFVFEVDDGEESELSLLQIMNSTDITQDNDYSIRFVEAEEHIATVLTLKKDLTIPFIATGFIIFLIGLFTGSYINHRRIWIKADDNLTLAAHTNKNYFGMKREINEILESNGLGAVNDKLDDADKDKNKE
ncbi:cytochrome c biogenesis protein ResB [Salinicoccus roseus]|uniref:Cytochrome c biogenesis protein ResB n=1 Tax=Salinicoccus roseus TaxID=45670 RepID=A0A0C2HE27_9STAP|nr:cytochrome c biogenesis protein ResB [Salinicoccus roseus]KIH71930.1 cytochrome c biogenesis protein ResB [Salinicoccus roseus]MDB0579074.1 cytochrome c biogenesis protein ResB [Salinicoccus roseus]